MVIYVLAITSKLSGQNLYNKLAIKNSNVKILNSYSMINTDDVITDSVLYRTLIFNEEGYVVYDQKISENGTTKQKYSYSSDTLLIGKDRLYNGKLIEKECYIYDDNKLVKIISLNENGDTMERYSTYEYNNIGKLKDHEMYFGDKLGYHYAYKYYKNGKIKSRKTKVGFKSCTAYGEDGSIKKEVSDQYKLLERSNKYYTDGKLKTELVEIKHKMRARFERGGKGLKIEKGDVEMQVTSYKNNGVASSQMTLINNTVHDIQHIHFITF